MCVDTMVIVKKNTNEGVKKFVISPGCHEVEVSKDGSVVLENKALCAELNKVQELKSPKIYYDPFASRSDRMGLTYTYNNMRAHEAQFRFH